MFNYFDKKGFLDENNVKTILESLLVAKELSINTTLQELFDVTNIEHHLFTTNLNKDIPISVDLSYKTHPDLLVSKAITMSCSIPFLFSPICYKDDCYIDGAFLNNFPLDSCINDNHLAEEILAVKINAQREPVSINSDTTFDKYLFDFINGIRRLVMKDKNENIINNIVSCDITNTYNEWSNAVSSALTRQNMIETGNEFAEKLLNKIKEQNLKID